MNKLTCAAIKDPKGEIHSCEGMARAHYDIIMVLPEYDENTHEHGFLDLEGNFLSRREASRLAQDAGQVSGWLRNPPFLYSDEIRW